MNGKYVSRTFVAILLCVTVLWAGDPWKEKASSEWTVKDVEKILKKSPWAQTKKIRLRPLVDPFIYSETAAERADRNSQELRAEKVFQRAGRSMPTAEKVRLPSKDPGPAGKPVVQVSIRWVSSRTIWEAFQRRSKLLSLPPSEQAQRIESVMQKFHIIGVEGFGVTPRTLEALKGAVTLEIKRTKKKINPVHIEASWGRAANSLGDLLFFFPREVEGEPLLTAKDKVTFFLPLPRPTNVKFNLGKMTRSGESDF